MQINRQYPAQFSGKNAPGKENQNRPDSEDANQKEERQPVRQNPYLAVYQLLKQDIRKALEGSSGTKGTEG